MRKSISIVNRAVYFLREDDLITANDLVDIVKENGRWTDDSNGKNTKRPYNSIGTGGSIMSGIKKLYPGLLEKTNMTDNRSRTLYRVTREVDKHELIWS